MHHLTLHALCSSGLTVSASIPAAIISMSILRSLYGKDVGKEAWLLVSDC